MYSLGQPITRVTKQVLALPGKDPAATKSMVQSSPEFHKYRDQLVNYSHQAEQDLRSAYQDAYAGSGMTPPEGEIRKILQEEYVKPAWDRYYQAVDEATQKVSLMQAQGLGDNEIEQFLGRGFKIKKVFKKVAKVVGKIHAPLIGAMTLGLVKPKALGFKSASAQKLYKIGGKVGKVGAIAVGGYFGLPLLATAVGAAPGTTFLGSLKFFGGKLVSAPANLFNKIKEGFIGKGESVEQAGQSAQNALQNMPVQDVLRMAYENGDITDQMMERSLEQLKYPQGVPSDRQYSIDPSQYSEGQQPIGTDLQPTESGMIAGLTPQTLVIGAGLLAIILFSGSPANRKR